MDTNINDLQHVYNGTANFKVYDNDFDEYRKGIGPTDIDLLVEIKGHFLMHEYKFEKSKLTTGQEIMQPYLLQKGFTIVNVWHRGPCIEMNLLAAEFKTPNCFPMPKYGNHHFYDGDGVLEKIKAFHKWWTGYVLHTIGKRK